MNQPFGIIILGGVDDAEDEVVEVDAELGELVSFSNKLIENLYTGRWDLYLLAK